MYSFAGAASNDSPTGTLVRIRNGRPSPQRHMAYSDTPSLQGTLKKVAELSTVRSHLPGQHCAGSRQQHAWHCPCLCSEEPHNCADSECCADSKCNGLEAPKRHWGQRCPLSSSVTSQDQAQSSTSGQLESAAPSTSAPSKQQPLHWPASSRGRNHNSHNSANKADYGKPGRPR